MSSPNLPEEDEQNNREMEQKPQTPPSGASEPFQVHTEQRRAGEIAVVVVGPLDFATVAESRTQLQAEMRHALEMVERSPSPATLTVDLQRVSVVDSVGLGFLLKLSQWLSGRCKIRFVAAADSQPERSLKLLSQSLSLDTIVTETEA